MRTWWLSVALVLSLTALSAGRASAGTLALDFELGSSFLTINSNFRLGNGFGPLVSAAGSARVTFDGVNAYGMFTGAAPAAVRLSNLALTFRVNVSHPATQIAGAIRIFQEPDPGPSNTSLFFGDELKIRIQGRIDCSRPSPCVLFPPPDQLTLPLAFDGLLTKGSGAMGLVTFRSVASRPGQGFLAGTLRTGQQADAVTLTVIGREVARTFVPEPQQSHLLLVALVCLSALTVLRIRRAG